MRTLFEIVDFLLEIYTWLIFAVAVLSWLIDFGALKISHPVVARVKTVLHIPAEPALRPIRTMLRSRGTIDTSPIVLILLLVAIRYAIAIYILPNTA